MHRSRRNQGGATVEIDGTLYQVIEVEHLKTEKSAVYR